MIDPPPFSIIPGRNAFIIRKHRAYVEGHTKVPSIFGTIVDEAGVNKPGAIEKYVDRSGSVQSIPRSYGVVSQSTFSVCTILQIGQYGLIDISCDHVRAPPAQGFRSGTPDTLSRSGVMRAVFSG